MGDLFSAAPRLAVGAGRDVLWQLLDGAGLEHFRLVMTDEGPLLTGVVVTSFESKPATIEYAVQCDPYWHTRKVSISIIGAKKDGPISLHLLSDGDGQWWQVVDDERTLLPLLTGCLDVDIAVTPSTNTLPIRRFDLVPGAKVRVSAAWVQFPSLEVTTLSQEYTRISRDQYRYKSFLHNFVAMLDVDDLGLVRDYEGLWARVTEVDVVQVLEETNDA